MNLDLGTIYVVKTFLETDNLERKQVFFSLIFRSYPTTLTEGEIKMKKNLVLVFAIFCVFIMSQNVRAESSRLNHRVGIYGTVLGDPFPSLAGINLALNATDFLRFNVGYGSVSGSLTSTSSPTQSTNFTFTTIGGGAKFMVPDWNFTPVLGINWSQVTVTTSGPSTTNTLYGYNSSASTSYVTLGLDWQAGIGFNLAFGFNESLTPGVGGLPYGQIGWFF